MTTTYAQHRLNSAQFQLKMQKVLFYFYFCVNLFVGIVDSSTPETRFCCDALRIVQENFRPNECLAVSECDEREDRQKEFVRLYGCSNPMQTPEWIKFPFATVRTDREDGWFPFKDGHFRQAKKFEWDFRTDSFGSKTIIERVKGSWITNEDEHGSDGTHPIIDKTFFDGNEIAPMYQFEGYEAYEVPPYVSLYSESCRQYDRQNVDYQNLPGNQIYSTIDLTQYTDCVYVVHFSFARDPYKVTLPYFNERDEQEAKEQLENPTSTSYFDEVTIKDTTRGYFSFPYFLVVRMVCQDEGYYGEEFYNVAVSGQNPHVNLFYYPPTSRAHFENPISVTITAVLINLEQDDDKIVVPDPDENFDTLLKNRQFFSLKDPTKKICYLNLCQPAYALPQPFLQIPILQINIPDDRDVAAYVRNIYVNPYHTRTTSGVGEIYIGRQFNSTGRNVTSVHPRYFFPKIRFTEVDLDLEPENLHICTVSEAAKLNYEYDIPGSFYLEGREHLLDWIVKEMERDKKALPLTRDDFFTPQFTFGTAPVVAIAGFYQPNLILLGDPEMDSIELIEWAFNPRSDPDARIFDAKGPCLTEDPYIKVNSRHDTPPTIQKPLYSQRQKDELRRYIPGRRSYLPTNYDINSRRAIFEIISLEDRILLKTTGGIVPLYGNSNATKGVDKILKAPEAEKLRRCFKIFRSLNTALTDYDPLLGVTYDYLEYNQTDRSGEPKKHMQEVWYGKYTQPGLPIEWTELGSKEYQDTLTPPVHIDPGIDIQEISTNIPEAAKICKTVYLKYVVPLFPNEPNRTAFRWTQDPDHHNCIILDGSPKPSTPNIVQLLLEMTFTYYKELDCNPDSPNFEGECEPLQTRKCLRYHYCVDLIAKEEKTPTRKNSTKALKCQLIPQIDCPQVPCYTVLDLNCSATTCSCPPCPAVTTCPKDHCHSPCRNCSDVEYFPRRCPCPPVPDLDAVGDYLDQCNKNDTLALCPSCPTNATDCYKSPFGPCKSGQNIFCPDDVFIRRKAPYCQKCMQDFFASLEGDYDYPVKKRISIVRNDTIPSDLDLCKAMVANNKSEDYCKFSVQDIRLFVLAQHEVGKPIVDGNSWEIITVFPKRPCTKSHFERILNIQSLDEAYFGEARLDQNTSKTCFERYITRPQFDIIMLRMTYTRHINNHLFIYGPRLYHSVDGGNTLVRMRDFPEFHEEFSNLDYDMIQILNEHVITVMAFSSGALYAFLTSKRELWLGTTGSIRQARLRPNAGWSMMRLHLYKNQMGVDEGIAFSVLFDSFDHLFELVALRDPEGHIDRVIKRSVDVQYILRNNYLVQDLQAHVNQQLVIGYKTNANLDFHAATVTKPFKPSTTLYIHYDIKDLSLYCPFSQLKIYQNYSRTLFRLQRFQFNPPMQHLLLGIDHKPSSLIAYSVSTFGMVYEAFLKKQTDEIYSNVRRDPIEKWRLAKSDEADIGYIRFLKKDPRQSGIVVDPREATTRIIHSANSTDTDLDSLFVHRYWLNYNQIVRLEIQFFIKNAQLLTKTDFLVQKLSEIQINVDNGNGEIVRLDTERQVEAKTASVKFIAHISLFQNDILKPSFPGLGLVTVPLTFHLIGGFGRCFKLEHWGMVGESLTTTIVAGCPPATGLLFDWNSTLHSLRFRSPTEKYGDSSYCTGGEVVCFSSKESITFYFDILDLSNQRYIAFDGKFKLLVIGGGKTKRSIRRYNQDQIDAYNIPGKSDISLMWTIAPENNETFVEKDPETQENILKAGVTQIRFTCNTLSPCARIAPRLDLQAEFYLLVRISNQGVDRDTLCIHEREFIILLYGFTPSPEIQITLTILGCLFLLSVMYIFYVCCRRHRRVWRANKLRITGWWQIILDTFPKAVKEGKDTVEIHRKRDSIVLSLQGHLRIPEVVSKLKEPEERRVSEELESVGGSSEDKASTHSGESEGSETSLPRVRARKKGATWTDMVYEQIISQRLLAIVNRNRRMREHVLSTPAPPADADDLDTASQEESIISIPVKTGTEKEEKKTV